MLGDLDARAFLILRKRIDVCGISSVDDLRFLLWAKSSKTAQGGYARKANRKREKESRLS